jgi:hypothetical protein
VSAKELVDLDEGGSGRRKAEANRPDVKERAAGSDGAKRSPAGS